MINIGIGIPFGQRGGIVTSFKSRVSADSGTFEAESCLNSSLNNLRSINLLNSASLLLTPNAYKVSKMYSIIPNTGEGDLTFTRASTAMRRNSSGLWESVANNVPRLHYPVDVGCPSWLNEPQRTYSILHNNNLSNAYWIKNQVTITPNSVSSPFQGLLADVIVENANTSQVFGVNTNPRPSGLILTTRYTVAFMAKKITRDWVYFQDFNAFQSPPISAWFNLNTGIVGTVGAGVSNASMTAQGDGWWLCEFEFVATGASGASCDYRIASSTANNTTSYTGTIGQQAIAVIAPMFYAGSKGASPIITAGSAVTRLVDIGTTANKSRITSSNFTLAIKLKSGLNVNTGNPYLGVDDVFFENGVYLRSSSVGNGNIWRAIVRRSSVSTEILSDALGLIISGQTIVIKVDGTQVKVFLGGSLRTTNTLAGTLPVLPNVFMTGANMSFQLDLFTTYNSALSDSECINLSTL
jgi:hypothetical protein